MSTVVETHPPTVPGNLVPTSSLGLDGDLLAVRHRITVEEYHRMAEVGIIGPEARVELLEGVIVEKMTKLTPHVHATDLVQYLLVRHVPAGYFFSMGNPVTIVARDSEPEPDAMVIRGRLPDFAGRRRTPADAALVIEVADTIYSIDRRRITYAAARVPVYWIVNLNEKRLEVFSNPVGEGNEASFASAQVLGPDEEGALVLDGAEVARFSVREILP